jgi:hypothetical protein
MTNEPIQPKKQSIIIIESGCNIEIFLYIKNKYNLTKNKQIFVYLYENCLVLEYIGSFWKTYENLSFFIDSHFNSYKISCSQQGRNIFGKGEPIDSFMLGRYPSICGSRKKALSDRAKELGIEFDEIEFIPSDGWYLRRGKYEVYLGFKCSVAIRNLEKI